MKNKIQFIIGIKTNDSTTLTSDWIYLNDFNSWEEIETALKQQGFVLNGNTDKLFIENIINMPTLSCDWEYENPKPIFEYLLKSGVLNDENKFEIMKAYCEVDGYKCWEDRIENYEDKWTDNISLYPNYDWQDLGRYFIKEIEQLEIPEKLTNYIDYARYGKQLKYSGFHEYSDGIIKIK